MMTDRLATTIALAVALILAFPEAAGSRARASAPVSLAVGTLPRGDYVVDQAGVLDEDVRHRLTVQLRRFERATRHQFVVVTVASLGGVDGKTFTRRLGNRWGIGRRGVNDGIVLLVAPHDRKARIAVGYGLTGALPDAFCQRVLARAMIPAFVRGAIGDGVQAGVTAIIDRFAGSAGEPSPTIVHGAQLDHTVTAPPSARMSG